MLTLYDPGNETHFDKNGDCILQPESCEIYARIDGNWQMTLVHPIDPAETWKHVVNGAIIATKVWYSMDQQLYRIYKTTKSINGITALARPIFMDAGSTTIINADFTGYTASQALAALTEGTKYHISTDITATGAMTIKNKSLLEALNGKDGFVEVYGAEPIYLIDNVPPDEGYIFHAEYNAKQGIDKGLEFRYGLNLISATEIRDMSKVVTRIRPFGYNNRTVTDSPVYENSPRINDYPLVYYKPVTYPHVKLSSDPHDNNDEVYSNQTQLNAALRRHAQEDFAAGADLPEIGLRVELGGDLSLSSPMLGDTVRVVDDRVDIDYRGRLMSVTYDCLREMTVGAEIGAFDPDYIIN